MNFNSLSDSALLNETRALVLEERELTARVLLYLKEIETRGLHLEMGFSSLFDFCTRELGYSENEANSRISAMRLGREIPEVVVAVEKGRLSLTNLVKAQAFFRQEKKAGNPVSIAAKKELLEALEQKSTRECERLLAEKTPHAVPAERERPVSRTHTQISFVADEALMADLEKIRALWGHQDLSYAEMIQKMAKLTLKQIDPAQTRVRKSPGAPKVKTEDSPPPELITPQSRHIPAATRRLVWKRDGGKCSYVYPETGRTCGSAFALEIDHLDGFAFGGSHAPENLRLLCRAHHALRTRKQTERTATECTES